MDPESLFVLKRCCISATQAGSKFDVSRCLKHDDRALHLLHRAPSYPLDTSTDRQCVAVVSFCCD
jgi:hypothetical protein